jgi:DNA-binding transcriptional regulator YiaG
MKIKTTDDLRGKRKPPLFTDPAITTAAHVKALRVRLNLSVADLAVRCGVSPRTVEGWEQGRSISGPARRALELIR